MTAAAVPVDNSPLPLGGLDDLYNDRSASLAAIARDELARIYTARVRQHHDTSVPLDDRWTRWERDRLSRAAQTLRGAR